MKLEKDDYVIVNTDVDTFKIERVKVIFSKEIVICQSNNMYDIQEIKSKLEPFYDTIETINPLFELKEE